MKRIFYAISVVIILTTQSVSASEQGGGVNWILLGKSPNLDRSTMYLSRGNTKSGIKYAKRIINKSKSELEMLIANHNLCLAFQMNKDTQSAEKHCSVVKTSAIPQLTLKQVKQGLYRVKRTSSDNAITLDSIITQNMGQFDEANRIALSVAY